MQTQRHICTQQREPVGRVTAAAARRTSHVACRAVAATNSTPLTATKVVLRTRSDCQLAVSRYPMFSYDASGGGGTGSVEQLGGGRVKLTFAAADLLIPALNWRTAKVLGVPIPPPLNIAIQPQRLEGVLDTATGSLDLEFVADFAFSAGPLYRAPSLKVATTLTSGHSAGLIHAADGEALNASGTTKLVGVARVPRVEGDLLLNPFLMLPTDALAIMRAELAFS